MIINQKKIGLGIFLILILIFLIFFWMLNNKHKRVYNLIQNSVKRSLKLIYNDIALKYNNKEDFEKYFEKKLKDFCEKSIIDPNSFKFRYFKIVKKDFSKDDLTSQKILFIYDNNYHFKTPIGVLCNGDIIILEIETK